MNAHTQQHIQGMQAAGQAVRAAFDAMVQACRAGMTTAELDDIGAAVLASLGARSAPKMYYDFPGATCISVNEEAAHGIPGQRQLRDGDMINIDVSANLDGFVADMGESFVVGQSSAEQVRLCEAVREAVNAAIAEVSSGRSLRGGFGPLGLGKGTTE